MFACNAQNQERQSQSGPNGCEQAGVLRRLHAQVCQERTQSQRVGMGWHHHSNLKGRKSSKQSSATEEWSNHDSGKKYDKKPLLRREEDNQRPHEIELLLDSKRPEVGHCGGKYIRLGREEKVLRIACKCPEVGPAVNQRNGCRKQHEVIDRHKTQEPSDVEIPDRYRRGGVPCMYGAATRQEDACN